MEQEVGAQADPASGPSKLTLRKLRRVVGTVGVLAIS